MSYNINRSWSRRKLWPGRFYRESTSAWQNSHKKRLAIYPSQLELLKQYKNKNKKPPPICRVLILTQTLPKLQAIFHSTGSALEIQQFFYMDFLSAPLNPYRWFMSTGPWKPFPLICLNIYKDRQYLYKVASHSWLENSCHLSNPLMNKLIFITYHQTNTTKKETIYGPSWWFQCHTGSLHQMLSL